MRRKALSLAIGSAGVLVLTLGLGAALVADQVSRSAAARKPRGRRRVTSTSRSAGRAEPIEQSSTPLHLAAARGHMGVVEALLEHGASANPRGEKGRTPLWLAVLGGHNGTIGVLLEHGANPNVGADEGLRPLHLAGRKGHQRIIGMLLEHKAEVNAQDARGRTALYLAVEGGHDGTAGLLLEHGGDPDLRSEDGLTALHFAARDGRGDLVTMLLAHGADADGAMEVETARGEAEGPAWVRGERRGCALRFDGRGDYVFIGPSETLDIRSSVTLAAWVKSDGDDNGQIIWRGDTRGGHDPYELHVAHGRMEFRVDLGDGTKASKVRAKERLDEQWHFWAGVYDQDREAMYLYKDGCLVGTGKASGKCEYDTGCMWNVIGAVDRGNWQHFAGTIDAVQVWSRALSGREVGRLLEQPPTGKTEGLVGYWMFDEGSGRDVKDSSGEGNGGVIRGCESRSLAF